MSLTGKTLGLLLGLILIATIGAVAYLALEFIVSLFAALDAQVARVTAIGSIVVLVASMIVAAAIRDASRRTRAAQVREQKAATYQLFVDCWTDEVNPPEKLQALDRLLTLYGGVAVIKAHAALRAIVREKGARHPDAAAQLGKALLEIRRDLGAEADIRGISALELQRLVFPVSGSAEALTPRTEALASHA